MKAYRNVPFLRIDHRQVKVLPSITGQLSSKIGVCRQPTRVFVGGFRVGFASIKAIDKLERASFWNRDGGGEQEKFSGEERGGEERVHVCHTKHEQNAPKSANALVLENPNRKIRMENEEVKNRDRLTELYWS